ncbi:MAG: hypothetical protein RLZZ628_4046 [Bacteroidota bacterium]|jgi:protein phosphatase
MTITIYPPIAMNERGRRAMNQDSIFPVKPKVSDTLFMVCDGVGGMAHGEDASRIICQSFAQSFENQSFSDSNFIASALLKAEKALNEYAQVSLSPKGVATTLTLLHLHQKGATVAHIGDSRVYQFRKNAIVFQTKDHSWVNELVAGGVITPEQARTHPQRNVIARAIQAGKPAKADVVLLEDVLPNDYFFLCSDGILEHLVDNQLIALLNSDLTDLEKMNEIFKICQENSKDNFSCCLVHIQSVDKNREKEMVQVQTLTSTKVPPQSAQRGKGFWVLMISMLVIGAGILCYVLLKG